MAGVSEQAARTWENRAVEEALSRAFDLGVHLEKVNNAGNLRILLHEGREEAEDLGFFQCSYFVGSDVLVLHVARLAQDFSEEWVRGGFQTIAYQPPTQDFTVIGPSRLHQNEIVAVHMKGPSWKAVVDQWRPEWAPFTFEEDPSVLPGHITPASKIRVVPWPKEEAE